MKKPTTSANEIISNQIRIYRQKAIESEARIKELREDIYEYNVAIAEEIAACMDYGFMIGFLETELNKMEQK